MLGIGSVEREAWLPILLSEGRQILHPILGCTDHGRTLLPDVDADTVEKIREVAHQLIGVAVVRLTTTTIESAAVNKGHPRGDYREMLRARKLAAWAATQDFEPSCFTMLPRLPHIQKAPCAKTVVFVTIPALTENRAVDKDKTP